jgi:hypothetical protein
MVKIAATLGAAALLIVTMPADSQAFRCGRGLVNIGDRTGKVLIECGPPTSKESVGSQTVSRTGKVVRPGKKEKASAPSSSKGHASKQDHWFYNCGDHDFIYVLTFEEGVLVKEETAGYGKGRSDCNGKGNGR